jgi:hypothetical protein
VKGKKMKKWISIIFMIVFIFGLGSISGQKAAFKELVGDFRPSVGFEQFYAQWTEKYGKPVDSLQFYRMMEIAAVINRQATAIRSKADANDVNEINKHLTVLDCKVAELLQSNGIEGTLEIDRYSLPNTLPPFSGMVLDDPCGNGELKWVEPH